MEINIEDLPIFQKTFSCYPKSVNYELKKVIGNDFCAIKIIDVILIPYTTTDIVTSKTITNSPKIISGNFICGYRMKRSKRSISYSEEEIETASNQTAYLCKITHLKNNYAGFWREIKENLPLVIVKPEELIKEIEEKEFIKHNG